MHGLCHDASQRELDHNCQANIANNVRGHVESSHSSLAVRPMDIHAHVRTVTSPNSRHVQAS